MKTHLNLRILFVLLLGTVVGAMANEPSLAQKIKRQPIFTTPLVWVGTNEPPEAESAALLEATAGFASGGRNAGYGALEDFVAAHAESDWAPSVRAHLADYYWEAGRYSAAFTHIAAIAQATRERKDPNATALATKARQRLRAIQGATGKEGNCGTLALSEVLHQLLPGSPKAHEVTHLAAPTDGFSLSDLAAIAESNNVPAIAARWSNKASLVAPAIMHYKLGHYLAVLELRDNQVRVFDSLSGGPRWLDREVLATETSGNYLLFCARLPAGWSPLTLAEADGIRGKVCNVPSTDIDDDEDDNDEDDDCPPPPPPEAGDGPGAGEGDPCAPEEAGMPRWRVSEPYISLWLHDTPLFYRLSSGRPFQLKLSYNHRASSRGPNVPSFGDKWECNWLGLLEETPTGGQIDYLLGFPSGGGRIKMPTSGAKSYKRGRSMQTCIVSGCTSGDQNIYTGGASRIEIDAPLGRKNQYGDALVYAGGAKRYFLTNRMDQYGRSVRFNYTSNYFSGTPVFRMTQVTDMDGKQCTLAYTNTSYPNQITSVTDPYSRTARFIYDHAGRLTNITDMAGMSSTFKYASDGSITNLATPYGTTSFRYLSNAVGGWNRAVEIAEPEGKQQLYMFRSESTSEMIGAGLPAYYPTLRNSYHWDRAQYQALSAAAKADPLNMAGTNYLKASIKNWYVLDRFNGSGGSYVSDAMNAQAGPAVDGGARVNGITYTYYGQLELEFSKGFYGIGLQGTQKKVTRIDWAASGDQLEIPRNAWGRPTQFIYWRNGVPAAYTNEFNADGRILRRVWGPNGEQLRGYGYDATVTNLLTSVTNALGEVLRYTHDSAQRVTSITHPSGLVTTNTYYASGSYAGFLQTNVDIGFRTNSYSYLNGNLLAHTNELGLVITNTWDNLNRRTVTQFPDGTTVSNVFDKLDLVATRDRLGLWTRSGYNALRQLTSVTNANNQVTLYDYCNCGSPSTITELNGGSPVTTQFTYDLAGRRTSTTYADGYTLNYFVGVDPQTSLDHGGPYRIEDTSGLAVHLGYADYGQLASIGLSAAANAAYVPDGYLVRRTFDPYGRLNQVTDRNGVTLTNAYDAVGRLTNRTTLDIYGSPANSVSYAHTARGLTNATDELGHPTWFVYDAAGRLLSQTNANGEALQFTYNPADQMLTLKDGKNQQTSWNYDPYGRVTNKLDAVREIFRYKYDPNSRLTNRWTEAKGDTFYGYDPIGNLTNVNYPGTVMDIVLKYDLLNRLTNITDMIGTTKFSYTDAGQLLSEDGPWASDTVSYGYSARRRSSLSVAQPNTSAWTQGYGYDQYNRLSNIVSAAGNFISQYWSGGSYSLPDRVQYLSLPGDQPGSYGTGGRVENAFDDLARLTSTALKKDYAVLNQHSYAMNAANQRTKQTISDGNAAGNTHFTDYTYDAIGQLQTAKGTDHAYDYGVGDYVNAARLNEQFGYAYDKAWNLNRRTNNALVQTFNVNNLNQLTNATRSGTLTVAGLASEPRGGDAAWGSPAGVTNVTVSGTGLTTGNANLYADGSWAKTNATLANGNNSYTATAKDTYDRTATDSLTVNLPATNTFSYDGNGNLTNDGRRVFEYDFENQLTNVYVASAWRSEFKFDAFGRRKVRKEYTWQSSTWTLTNEVRYVYDGMLVVQERDANNLALVSYTRGNDLSGTMQGAGGIGGLLARTDNGQLIAGNPSAHAYYHADGNGNIAALVNTNGSVVARYNYDPYGNLLGMSGPLAEANTYRFSSKEYQANAGLYYYGFRFYEPNLQRWLNRDPIGEQGGINLYRINSGDTLNRIDAYGLDTCKLVGPFLVVYPHPLKFWRPSEEVYWGGPELYKQIVGEVQLQNAIEAAATAAAIAAATALVADHSEELEDAKEQGYQPRPRDKQPDKMGGEDSDPSKGKLKKGTDDWEKMRRELEKEKEKSGRGGADNIDPSCPDNQD